MAPKKHIADLIKIYQDCRALLPSLPLSAFFEEQGQPINLSASAQAEDVIKAMNDLCIRVTSSLSLSEDTKTIWANHQAMLFVADDADMLLKIFDKIKVLFDEQQLLSIQSSKVKKNILVSKTTIILDDDYDPEQSPPAVEKKFAPQIEFGDTDDAPSGRTMPVNKHSSLLKKALKNSLSKSNATPPANYQPLYQQYLIMEENYQNLVGANSNNNSSSSKTLANMSEAETIQAIINIIKKIKLVSLEGFILADNRAKLNELQRTLMTPEANCNYFVLFSKYAKILSEALGWQINAPSAHSMTINLQTILWNNNNNSNNNHYATAQTSSTMNDNTLTQQQKLYQQYEEIEKNYFSLLNTSSVSKGTNSSLQFSLRTIPPTDTTEILQTLLKFVKRVDFNPIMPHINEEQQRALATRYSRISNLEPTTDAATFETALSDLAQTLHPMLQELKANIFNSALKK